MKRITDYRKLFEITKDTDLAELKLIYRRLRWSGILINLQMKP